jgi:hypothetical protein
MTRWTKNTNGFPLILNGKIQKQLIAATNNKGEKEVWVNCFCRIYLVEDGGNCFFILRYI